MSSCPLSMLVMALERSSRDLFNGEKSRRNSRNTIAIIGGLWGYLNFKH